MSLPSFLTSSVMPLFICSSVAWPLVHEMRVLWFQLRHSIILEKISQKSPSLEMFQGLVGVVVRWRMILLALLTKALESEARESGVSRVRAITAAVSSARVELLRVALSAP